jgi:hypothetical protein
MCAFTFLIHMLLLRTWVKVRKKKLGTAIVGSREYEHTHESNPSSPWTDVGMKKETIL